MQHTISLNLGNTGIGNHPSGVVKPGVINKTWGREEIFQNELNGYCMKLLVINEGESTSEHFHLLKHETFYVISGLLEVVYIKDKQHQSIFLTPGESFVVAPGFVHRLRAAGLGPTSFIEASTTSWDEDSIRIG